MTRNTLACLLLAACSPGLADPAPPVGAEPAIVVCIDLPLEHEEEARLAVERWDRALSGWRRVTAVFGPAAGMHCDKFVVEVGPDAGDGDDVAFADRLGGDWVYMIKGKYTYDVARVLGHELGHAFGCQHTPQGTLMAPKIGPDTPLCPDVTAVAQVAAYHRFELDMVKPMECE